MLKKLSPRQIKELRESRKDKAILFMFVFILLILFPLLMIRQGFLANAFVSGWQERERERERGLGSHNVRSIMYTRCMVEEKRKSMNYPVIVGSIKEQKEAGYRSFDKCS